MGRGTTACRLGSGSAPRADMIASCETGRAEAGDDSARHTRALVAPSANPFEGWVQLVRRHLLCDPRGPGATRW